MKIFDAQNNDLKTVNSYLKESLNGKPVPLKNAVHLHGLASGLQHGEVLVEGDTGDYLGVLNDGATIHVTHDTGRYLGDNMTGGTVIIEGDAGFGAAQYCYGGTVVIRGSAGDFTATMNKGATIIVGGDVGDEVGTYMLKGDLIVVGNAGKNFANYLIRGSVYHRRRVGFPGAQHPPGAAHPRRPAAPAGVLHHLPDRGRPGRIQEDRRGLGKAVLPLGGAYGCHWRFLCHCNEGCLP